MKVIENGIIPKRGYILNLFGVLFVRRNVAKTLDETNYNHEAIHTAQMKELLYIPFYIIYVIEWLFRLVFYTKTAYKGLSFEVEANEHMADFDYLSRRRHFAQWRRNV